MARVKVELYGRTTDEGAVRLLLDSLDGDETVVSVEGAEHDPQSNRIRFIVGIDEMIRALVASQQGDEAAGEIEQQRHAQDPAPPT